MTKGTFGRFIVGRVRSLPISDGANIAMDEAGELSPEQSKEFERDKAVLADYIAVVELWHTVKDNLIDFINHFHKTVPFVITEADLFGVLPSRYSREASRMLMNTVFMFRAFLDHADTLISRKFGKGSEQYSVWKGIKSAEYDSRFAYRFIYKLRNYTQHVGSAPLQWRVAPDSKQGYREFEAMFELYSLVSDYDGWGKQLTEDLKSQPDYIDAITLLQDWGDSSYRVFKGLVSILQLEALGSATRLASLRNNFSSEGTLVIFQWQNENQFLMKQVPEKDAELILSGYPYNSEGELALDYRSRTHYEIMDQAASNSII